MTTSPPNDPDKPSQPKRPFSLVESYRQACLRNKPWLHSTGPRTPEGKRRVSQNARKHGRYSRETKRQRAHHRAQFHLMMAYFDYDLTPMSRRRHTHTYSIAKLKQYAIRQARKYARRLIELDPDHHMANRALSTLPPERPEERLAGRKTQSGS